MFPVQRPVSFLQKEKWTIFSYQKKKNVGKKRKKCSRPTGHNFGHPLDRKHTFFYGQPKATRLSGTTKCKRSSRENEFPRSSLDCGHHPPTHPSAHPHLPPTQPASQQFALDFLESKSCLGQIFIVEQTGPGGEFVFLPYLH